MATPEEVKEGIEIFKRGFKKQAPALEKIMADTLSQPLKKCPQDCQCNACLVAAKRREIRARNIKRKRKEG